MSDIIRRDPRKAWIARNRLHPEHASVLAELGMGDAQPAQWMGPNGVMRKDPHRVGFIGPAGIKRIDRSGVQGAPGQVQARSTAAQDTRTAVLIAEPAFHIVVVPDMAGGRLSAHDRDLLGLARQMADKNASAQGAVVAIVFGELKEDSWGEAGIDRLLHLSDAALEGYSPEYRIAILSAAERELKPRYWLFPDSSLGGGDLGRRLSVRIGERAATQVWQVDLESETPRCTGRGAAGRKDITRDLPRVLLALAECGEPVSDTRHEAQAIQLQQPLPEQLVRIEDLGAVAVDPASVALSEAEFILSGGNGVRDWDGFHQAARVLGATEGASRVAVDDGFMARDRQVGATGTWVTARVYMAVGISGAIQHLQGIQSCDKVIAINMDPGCDMIKRADLAVIGDSGEILSELVKRVDGLKQENRDVA
ncbi:electron transfer flavoprotein subunit alpha/FixB family protein [Nitrincola alkalilacustris]|uniref:electron transfer flavoprotein subunit alpha n=1 Tax=Nitrincola alkalilacustris TaxID=1571224 RepID=UPI00124F4EF8|nr:electron transfer flavoprotein subunit alpha/FixB family protein [Nitrincola alkalilacustris]